jgi:hypothetical protein
MAEEGAGEVAPVLGGGIDALVVGVEETVVDVEEAAKGVIMTRYLACTSSPSQRNFSALKEVDHRKS